MASGTNPTKVVRDRLSELGWSTTRLARELEGEVSRSTVFGWMAGKRKIRVDALEPILKKLGLVVKNAK